MKESARAMAKVYLPPRPDESADLPPPAAPTAATTAPAVAITPVPTVYRGIPHPRVLPRIALE